MGGCCNRTNEAKEPALIKIGRVHVHKGFATHASMSPEQIESILEDNVKLSALTDDAFENIDIDRSGYIEINELKVLMNEINDRTGAPQPTEEEVTQIMDELDADGNGVIDREEFKVLMKDVLQVLLQNKKAAQ